MVGRSFALFRDGKDHGDRLADLNLADSDRGLFHAGAHHRLTANIPAAFVIDVIAPSFT